MKFKEPKQKFYKPRKEKTEGYVIRFPENAPIKTKYAPAYDPETGIVTYMPVARTLLVI